MFKKKGFVALTTLIALGVSAHAAADTPTSELKVTGSLATPGCVVTIGPDDSYFNLGSILAGNVPDSGYRDLPNSAGPKNIDVNCDANTYLTFTVVDNKHDTLPADKDGPGYFGMGKVNGTGSLGYYILRIHDTKIDGVAAEMFNTATGIQSETVRADILWGLGNDGALKYGQRFETIVDLWPYVANKTVMNGPITSDASVNGSVTFNFSYGI